MVGAIATYEHDTRPGARLCGGRIHGSINPLGAAMKIHLRYDDVNPGHAHVTLFVNGANCGQLCLLLSEAIFLGKILNSGCAATGHQFVQSGMTPALVETHPDRALLLVLKVDYACEMQGGVKSCGTNLIGLLLGDVLGLVDEHADDLEGLLDAIEQLACASARALHYAKVGVHRLMVTIPAQGNVVADYLCQHLSQEQRNRLGLCDRWHRAAKYAIASHATGHLQSILDVCTEYGVEFVDLMNAIAEIEIESEKAENET
jgi:hypothetical protein